MEGPVERLLLCHTHPSRPPAPLGAAKGCLKGCAPRKRVSLSYTRGYSENRSHSGNFRTARGPRPKESKRNTGRLHRTVAAAAGRSAGLIRGEPGVLLFARLRRLTRRRGGIRSEEHTSELQSLRHLVCRLLLEKKHK